jgi:hypothetical protein
MDRLCRFKGAKISIDGIEGEIIGPKSRTGPKYLFTAEYAGTVPDGDSHYRFVWKEGEQLHARIISGKSLSCAPDDNPHGYRRFVFHDPGFGIVGTIEQYDGKLRVHDDDVEEYIAQCWSSTR